MVQHFAVLPTFWIETEIRFHSDLNRSDMEHDVVPHETGHFLFTKSHKKKCQEQGVLSRWARGEECLEFSSVVFDR